MKTLKTQYIARRELEHLLAALMPANRLALELSLATGLRISDCLCIQTEKLKKTGNGRLTITEMKTGKKRRIYIPAELRERMLKQAGRYYIFENRRDSKRTRTRQAVFKDLKRVARIFRLRENIAPHTCRKVYAVEYFKKCGDIHKVQELLNHSDEAVTMLYAMADVLTERTLGRKKH